MHSYHYIMPEPEGVCDPSRYELQVQLCMCTGTLSDVIVVVLTRTLCMPR